MKIQVMMAVRQLKMTQYQTRKSLTFTLTFLLIILDKMVQKLQLKVFKLQKIYRFYFLTQGKKGKLLLLFSSLFQQTKQQFSKIFQSHNQIGKLGAKSIADSLQDCFQLQELTLQFQGGNRIGDIGLESLSELIRNQQCLEAVKIDLSYTNYISEIGIKSLMNSLIIHQDNLKTLTLHLRNNSILDEGASYIGEQLSAFKKLQSFSISIKDNGIKNQGYFKLIEGISSLEKILIDLHISATFTRPSFQAFCSTIEKLNLKKLSLDLRMSCFNDSQLENLSRSFQNLFGSLTQVKINLSENEFGDEGALALIKSLSYLNIFDIKINYNKLTNDGIVKMLKYVTLNMNQLNSFKFEAIEEKTSIQDNFDRRKIYLEKLINLNYFSLNLSQIIWEEYFSQEERIFSNQIWRVRRLVAFDTNKIFK